MSGEAGLSPRTRAVIGAAGAAMALLCVVGPMELRVATTDVAGLRVSAAELLAALTIAVGLIAMAMRALQSQAGLRTLLRPASVALLAWAAVHLASGLWAADDKTFVLKFGLRVAGGVALALIAASLGDLAVFRRRVQAGLLVGLAAMTVIAALERLIGQPMEGFLRLFRDEPTWMLGEQRLSAVFYHANTFAAYLELTLPFVLLFVVSRRETSRKVAGWVWLIACGAMLSLTYSRAGLVAGVIGALALLWSARRSPRWPALARNAGVFAALVALAYGANPDMRARFGLGEREYRVRYSFFDDCIGHAGGKVTIPMRVSNIGQWAVSNRQAPGQLAHVVWSGRGFPERSAFRYRTLADLLPGERVELNVTIELPKTPGLYTALFDIRRKGVLWIGSVGGPIGRLRCEARPPQVSLHGPWDPGPEAEAGLDRDIRFQGRPLELSRKHYWQAGLDLFARQPLTGIGADRFRFAYREFVPARAWDRRARSHSVIIETAANLGLLGLLALGLLAGVIGHAIFTTLRRRDPVDRTALAAAAALLSFGLHSTLDYFLGYMQIILIVWPIVGLLLATPAQNQAKEAEHAHTD